MSHLEWLQAYKQPDLLRGPFSGVKVLRLVREPRFASLREPTRLFRRLRYSLNDSVSQIWRLVFVIADKVINFSIRLFWDRANKLRHNYIFLWILIYSIFQFLLCHVVLPKYIIGLVINKIVNM